MYEEVFERARPAHERYGYGELGVGQHMRIAIIDNYEARRIRNGLSSYSQNHRTRYKTTVAGGFLYIKRIA